MIRKNWKTIWGLPKKSLRARVRIDIEHHDYTIKYYKKWIQYYIRANTEKYALLDVLDGKITDSRQIRRVIKNLKRSRRTHLWDRKDRHWSKAWVKVYDDWIAHLNGMLGQ